MASETSTTKPLPPNIGQLGEILADSFNNSGRAAAVVWESPELMKQTYPYYDRNKRDSTLKLKSEEAPHFSPSSYSGYKLTFCSMEATLGNRMEISAHDYFKESDQFSSENLYALTRTRKEGEIEIDGIIPNRMIVLNQDAKAGRICLYAGNRAELLKITEFLDDGWFSHKFDVRWSWGIWFGSRCETILNEEKVDSLNHSRCEALITSLNTHLGRKSWWEKFMESSTSGFGFTWTGGLATLTVFLGRSFLKRRKEKKGNDDQNPPAPPVAPIPAIPVPVQPPTKSLAAETADTARRIFDRLSDISISTKTKQRIGTALIVSAGTLLVGAAYLSGVGEAATAVFAGGVGLKALLGGKTKSSFIEA